MGSHRVGYDWNDLAAAAAAAAAETNSEKSVSIAHDEEAPVVFSQDSDGEEPTTDKGLQV